jgi:4-hydroxy-4-methyl-2-oxoglutarate aldolase
MKTVVVTDVRRAEASVIDALGSHGVATVHEAMGRTGLVGASLRPIQQGVRIAGSAVTVLCWPGDNLMIHAAVEQCREGDVLVVTTASPSLDGSFGELFATALQHRGVLGLVTTGGVRDVADLRAMGFPVWSAAVNAQGTVKATAGSVNVPITVGGTLVRPGDVIVADDDGVLCVPRGDVQTAREAADARVMKEAQARAAYLSGELSLDRNRLRRVLDDLGVRYVSAAEYSAAENGAAEHRAAESGADHGHG